MSRDGSVVEDEAPAVLERRELRVRLLEDAAGDDVFRLRADAVRAARALELPTGPEPAAGASRPTGGGLPTRTAALVAAAGLAAGLLLALLLARTVFAPAYQCHSYPSNGATTFTCVRAR
jgi:hypothetical protein